MLAVPSIYLPAVTAVSGESSSVPPRTLLIASELIWLPIALLALGLAFALIAFFRFRNTRGKPAEKHKKGSPILTDPSRKKGRARLSKRKRALLICLSVLIALGGSAACVFLNNEARYQDALTYARRQEFDYAAAHISKVFLHYKDSDTLAAYISAGRTLQAGNYNAARPMLKKLGRYLDCDQLLLACDFEQAKALLKSENYAAAAELFLALSQSGYPEAQYYYWACCYRKST